MDRSAGAVVAHQLLVGSGAWRHFAYFEAVPRLLVYTDVTQVDVAQVVITLSYRSVLPSWAIYALFGHHHYNTSSRVTPKYLGTFLCYTQFLVLEIQSH